MKPPIIIYAHMGCCYSFNYTYIYVANKVSFFEVDIPWDICLATGWIFVLNVMFAHVKYEAASRNTLTRRHRIWIINQQFSSSEDIRKFLGHDVSIYQPLMVNLFVKEVPDEYQNIITSGSRSPVGLISTV